MSNNSSIAPDVADQIVTEYTDRIIIATFASVMAFGLVLPYAITITRFRLWHSSPILEKIPQVISSPLAHALSIGVGLVAVFPQSDSLYSIWLVILALIFDNVQAISKQSLLERTADRMSREYVFLYNCVIIGTVVIKTDRRSDFYHPLVALWCLLVLKFLERLVNYKIGDRSYGIKNTNIVASYMEREHLLSHDGFNPQTMEGYKYLVMGEEKVPWNIKHPSYNLDHEDSNEIVTLERVWACNNRFLNPTVDKDNRIKDVCLSFALFKLIRRRFFGFPASESKEPKTKQFVFEGLLSRPGKAEDVFRVIKTEIGFLRDFFYTQYPIAFALGFPVFSVLMLIVMCAISISISAKAFRYEESFQNEIPMSKTIKDVDHRITNGLLVIIIMTQILEVFSYTFSDWMKTTMISRHVRSKIQGTIPVIDQILGLLTKFTFNNNLRNTIGQYSLLKSYNKGGCKRVPNNFIYRMTCTMVLTRMPEGLQEDKEIFLPIEVKSAVFDALKISKGDFTDRLAPLRRNKVPEEDVRWLESDTTLKDRPIHTIMVWHIATSLCEIRPLMNQPIIEHTNDWTTWFAKSLPGCLRKKGTLDEHVLNYHMLVASSLSKYCAYLVAFAPELLPTTPYLAKKTFERIVSETSDFFDNEDRPTTQYEKVMKDIPQIDENGEKIIDMGTKLGRYLMEKIPDDARRWKVMADVWADLILYVAPKGHTSGHLQKLANGGEFITHLWALLYHAGIVVSVSDECGSFT
ncbi:hypothetical protein LUZ60_016284 [Juncus effusus]|nr:hypothetical protein LUZ60_016284 [Juncus effusus]